ncbi:hypothetical protein DUNSADRAFT_7687 [Dunaliella salina]|uniref:Uncharacterized protein n=1 Tax=Dunaliella salina TaxID=3046 RepID=A0ABQ7H689_DUNSA|nr:hypothetical protein DUNSADRAFT_7687 [Dunaliella salina]|eukprot:KAF5842373.1 hypothetical protein DUNSADRAFT_7687 [Dunaliella salina]
MLECKVEGGMVIKLALFLQFVTCGFLFYGCELVGHFDTGDAFRATLGLVLGYVSRPFFKMEALLYPIYNAVLRGVLPDAVFEVPASSREATYSTINSIGITLAAAFLVPQVLLKWSVDDCSLLAAPLTVGWLLFDITYMSSLLLVIQRDAPEE